MAVDGARCEVRQDVRARNLRKKLAQIAELEQKCAEEGYVLSDEQATKLSRKAQLEEELNLLLASPELPESSQSAHEASLKELRLPLETTSTREPSSADSGGRSCRSPSLRWQDDPVGVEDVAPTPKCAKAPEFEVLEAVQPFGASTQASAQMRSLVAEVSKLSQDAFEEDALAMVSRKSRWKLTIIARPGSLSGPSLIGFVIYRIRPELQSFSIAKLAVVPEHRGQGHGCRLVEWCKNFARRQQQLSTISLSSLPDAVRFYRKLGFRPVTVQLDRTCQCDSDEELVEGQVYMEFRIKGAGGRKKAR